MRESSTYGAAAGIDGPTTKAFCAPPLWGSLESSGPIITKNKYQHVVISKTRLSN